MKSCRIFCRRAINAMNNREEKVQKFLSILTSNGVHWFKEFIEALAKHEKYLNLVNLLEPGNLFAYD